MNQDIEWIEQGNSLSQNQDFKGAIEMYKKASQLGNSYATYLMAICTFYGLQHQHEGFSLLKEAASQGSVDAMIKIGDFYRFGHYVEKDWDQAYEIYASLYSEFQNLIQDVPEITLKYGECFLYGIGTDKDFAHAKKLFQDAYQCFSQLEEPEAQENAIKCLRYIERCQRG